jgi:TRAP-type C4-dicarboxylate transport system permease large subunit
MYLSLPTGMTISQIFDNFISQGLLRGFYFIFIILVYYISKILVWVIMYGLISFLWLEMARRGKSIWLLLLAIFLILLIFGMFVSYSNFIHMLGR